MGNTIQKLAFPVPNPPVPLAKKGCYEINVEIDNIQHKIPILYLPCKNNQQKSQKSTLIIYSHPNGMDLGGMCPYLEQLKGQLGADVAILAYEYLGYGFSKVNNESMAGTCSSTLSYPLSTPKSDISFTYGYNCSSSSSYFPSEQGCNRCLEATYRHATKNLGFKPEQIVLMGQSIGTGPTLDLGSKVACGGIILITPFKSCAKVITESSLGYCVDFFINEEKIGKVKSPTFLIHGTMDEVVPFSHSLALEEILARGSRKSYYYPPLWIPGATHNNIINYRAVPVGIKKFINSL